MAKFDHQTLEYLKKLCKLECTPKENEEILSSLGRILDYVELLKEVDTEKTKTCRYVLRTMMKNRLREDKEIAHLDREQFLANAPDQVSGLIKIPRIKRGTQQ